MDQALRKRTACDRCRKLKVACRKPDLAEDAVCERCLRAGFVCLTEDGTSIHVESRPDPMKPVSDQSNLRFPPDDTMSDTCYFLDSHGAEGAGAHDSILSDFISTFSGTHTDTSDSHQSGFNPDSAGLSHVGTEQMDIFLTAPNPAKPKSRGLSIGVGLDSNAVHVLWDISRQLAIVRDSSWDPQTVRLGWLDANFSMTNARLSPPEVLVAISTRYTMLLRILAPNSRVTLKLMLLTTYVQLTQMMERVLAEVVPYASKPDDSYAGNAGTGPLQTQHHIQALVETFEFQLMLMESLLGLPAEYRATSGNVGSSGVLGFGDSCDLLSAVMGQQEASGTSCGTYDVGSVKMMIDRIRMLLQSS